MTLELRGLRYSGDPRRFRLDLIPRDPNIASKIESGKVVVEAIHKDRVPLYLEAGLANGFEVRIIAEVGQAYFQGVIHTELGLIAEETTLEIKDYVAVSIERPEGPRSYNNYAPFWDSLKSLEQKKA